MHLATILLLGLATADGYQAHVEWSGDLYAAPMITALPPTCGPLDDVDCMPRALVKDDGVWLPMELNNALGAYRNACKLLPGSFQLQLDKIHSIVESTMNQGIEIGMARAKAEFATEALRSEPLADPSWPTWIRTVAITVAGLVLVVGGGFIGWCAHGGC